MVKVYAIVLAASALGLVVLLIGGAWADNAGKRLFEEPRATRVKTVVAAGAGFGMAGMSAEFSPLDFSWPVALAIAALAAVASVAWVRYAIRQAGR